MLIKSKISEADLPKIAANNMNVTEQLTTDIPLPDIDLIYMFRGLTTTKTGLTLGLTIRKIAIK